MLCGTARKRITAYLAGECRLSEKAALERHLAACVGCAAELEELRHLDRALDLWQTGPAPAGLWETVMGEVSGISRGESTIDNRDVALSRTPENKRRAAFRTRPALLLRDLAVAAAVSAVIFWGGGPWLAGEKMLAAGESINGAVSAYTRVTGTVVERATGTAGEYTRKIIFEEWKQDEMHESPGS